MAKVKSVHLLPTQSFSSQPQSSRVYGSMRSESLDDTVVLLPKSAQLPARQPCHGMCTRLKTAFRFQDDALEQQFVEEQYRTPCFMRTATVFGVIQIIIAPSIFYDPIFLTSPTFFASTLFKSGVIAYVSVCAAGGFVLMLFSRLSRTHNWWTVVGTSSTMLTFCGYFYFIFIYSLLFASSTVTFDEQGQMDIGSKCNGTMFRASEIFFGQLEAIAFPNGFPIILNQSKVHRWDFGFMDNACLHRHGDARIYGYTDKQRHACLHRYIGI